MAETGTLEPTPLEPTHPEPSARPAEERGTLAVRDRLVRHVIEQVALEVPQTVARDGLLGRLGSTASPSVDVDLRNGLARVEVRVAVAWPCPVASVAEQVRDAVLHRTPDLSGVKVATVDVVVEPMLRDADETRRVL